MGRLSRIGRSLALHELAIIRLGARWGPAPVRDLGTVVLDDGEALAAALDRARDLIDGGELTQADALIRHIVHIGARPNEVFRAGGPRR